MAKLCMPSIILIVIFFTSSRAENSVDKFYQCFQALTGFSAAHTLHQNTSADYQTILLSSAQNFRFVNKATAAQKPAIIITPEKEEHVAVIVKCAYRYDLQLRTRSGGHDYEGMSYVALPEDNNNKGALSIQAVPFIDIDLAGLNMVEVNATDHTAWVQAGATLGELYYYVNKGTKGTAGFPAGNGLTVGMGGHVSSGGFGSMSRKFGTAADNVIDAKLVGTCGEILDREEMGEELFWAIRGGGAASFGVVVAYKIKLVDVPKQVAVFRIERNIVAGNITRQRAIQLITKWNEVAPNVKRELFIQAVVEASRQDPSGQFNIGVQFTAFFLGTCTQFLSTLNEYFSDLSIKKKDCKNTNWLQANLFINGISDYTNTTNLIDRSSLQFGITNFKGKSDFVTQPLSSTQWGQIFDFLNTTLTARVLSNQGSVTLSLIMLPLGGRMSEISEAEIPFPHRNGNLYNIQYYTRWSSTDSDAITKHVDLVKNVSIFMKDYVSQNPRAAYYGYKDIELGRNKGIIPSYNEAKSWGEKYFKNNFERLARIKREVDAGNYFRNEQSIPPYNSWEVIALSSPLLHVSLQCSVSTCMCLTEQMDLNRMT